MSYLVIAIEDMVRQYITAKIDDDTLRMMSGYDLQKKMREDEEAVDDFIQRLLYLVMEEINWNKIVDDAKTDLPDLDEEDETED